MAWPPITSIASSPIPAAFVWFCTPEGLSRFDGRRVGGFVTFGIADGLPDRAVNAFLETCSGAYLVGTPRGLARFDRAAPGNKFSTVPLPGGKNENYITALFETNLSLHFHSVKGRCRYGMAEVADFHAPVFTAVDAILVDFQSTVISPSWTSRVRVPSPAHVFNSLQPNQSFGLPFLTQ
jgi:hypothetical protein